MSQSKLRTLSQSLAVRFAAAATAMYDSALATDASRRRKRVRAQPQGAVIRSFLTRRRPR
ncbi:hypothetical protein C7389_12831 [Azoarcus indigens]|uniref:Uncharacterized protein n=1 Tax=Azoarcus indigens TaxID=29545 RepID=A0A4R6DMG8_9RHOO|nr:hypothetical protein C7389_12831 [Azoarcus indigens]